MVNTQIIEEKLEKLGMKSAANRVKVLRERKRKLAIAYEHYRFVKEEKILEFNAKLREKFDKKTGRWKQLALTPLDQYENTPPEHVLTALETAIGRQCFDIYEVAHIVEVKDPILFGRVTGCTDRFFIDEWGDDVKIADLLKDNEG